MLKGALVEESTAQYQDRVRGEGEGDSDRERDTVGRKKVFNVCIHNICWHIHSNLGRIHKSMWHWCL